MKSNKKPINIKGLIFDIIMIVIAVLLGYFLYRKIFGDNPILMIVYFSAIIGLFLCIFFGRRGINQLRKYEKEEKEHPITEEDRPKIFRLSIQALLPLYAGILLVSCIPIMNIESFILVAFPSSLLAFIPIKRVYDLQKYLAKYRGKFWLIQLAICLPLAAIGQTLIQLLR